MLLFTPALTCSEKSLLANNYMFVKDSGAHIWWGGLQVLLLPNCASQPQPMTATSVIFLSQVVRRVNDINGRFNQDS